MEKNACNKMAMKAKTRTRILHKKFRSGGL